MHLWLRRLGAFLALIALFAFTFHLEHGHENISPKTGHHCCICHTTGIPTTPVTASFQPPTQLSQRLPYYGDYRAEAFAFDDSAPRGPPCA